MFEKPADSGCLEDCEKEGYEFEECYKYCQEHTKFKKHGDVDECS